MAKAVRRAIAAAGIAVLSLAASVQTSTAAVALPSTGGHCRLRLAHERAGGGGGCHADHRDVHQADHRSLGGAAVDHGDDARQCGRPLRVARRQDRSVRARPVLAGALRDHDDGRGASRAPSAPARSCSASPTSRRTRSPSASTGRWPARCPRRWASPGTQLRWAVSPRWRSSPPW